MKIVLITGASSGIGLETANQLASKGFTVYGTSRNPKANRAEIQRQIRIYLSKC